MAPLAMRYPIGAAGDWLSGRALRSHRRGHWFDPSIAHQVEGRDDYSGSHGLLSLSNQLRRSASADGGSGGWRFQAGPAPDGRGRHGERW